MDTDVRVEPSTGGQHDEVLAEISTRSGEELLEYWQCLPEDERHSKSVLLAAIPRNAKILRIINYSRLVGGDVLFDDEEFMAMAIAIDTEVGYFCRASDRLKNSVDFATRYLLPVIARYILPIDFRSLCTFQHTAHFRSDVFECLGPLVRSNKNFMMDAIDCNSSYFIYASDVLKDDKEFVMKAVRLLGDHLQYASPSLRADKEVVLTALTAHYYNETPLRFAEKSLRRDRDVALAAIRQDNADDAIKYIDNSLYDDEDVMLGAASIQPMLLEYASPELMDNESFIKRVIEVCDYDSGDRIVWTKFVSYRVRNSLDFAWQLMNGFKEFPSSLLLYLGQRPRSDPDVYRRCICNDARLFPIFDQVNSCRYGAIMAVSLFPPNLHRVGPFVDFDLELLSETLPLPDVRQVAAVRNMTLFRLTFLFQAFVKQSDMEIDKNTALQAARSVSGRDIWFLTFLPDNLKVDPDIISTALENASDTDALPPIFSEWNDKTAVRECIRRLPVLSKMNSLVVNMRATGDTMVVSFADQLARDGGDMPSLLKLVKDLRECLWLPKIIVEVMENCIRQIRQTDYAGTELQSKKAKKESDISHNILEYLDFHQSYTCCMKLMKYWPVFDRCQRIGLSYRDVPRLDDGFHIAHMLQGIRRSVYADIPSLH